MSQIFTPRWYQKEAVDATFDYIYRTTKKHPLIALPTGTGKSVVIGETIRRSKWQWPRSRLINITHVEELVSQNAEKLEQIWPNAPYGIYHAGLNRRDTKQDIIFGGVQSMFRNAEEFGFIDAVLIDEAHRINPDDETMYAEFFKRLERRNPNLRKVGYTATYWREKNGLIVGDGDDTFFDEIVYNMCDVEGFARLVGEGYLAPLFPRPTETKIPLEGLRVGANGDFTETSVQRALDKEEITNEALTEALRWGHDRKSWIVFASGVDHCEHIAAWLRGHGISAEAIHNKTSKADRRQWIKDHKSGKIRCLVSNNILTTGYDNPFVDFIIMLRPTNSVSLWVQMLGRGTRPAPGKFYCLVLDFVRNTERLGPINDPHIPEKKGKGSGDAPVRICDNCGNYNHASARYCVACGQEFEFQVKIEQEASNKALMAGHEPVIETLEVERVYYSKHQSRSKPLPSLKLQYFVKGRPTPINEYVNLEHPHPARFHAGEWWRTRHNSDPPQTIDEALQFQAELRVPYRLRVWTNKDYPEIVGAEYDA